MTTHRAIVDALFKSAADAESVVLATVVRIIGSSYGGVGTRMVARVDGSTVGVVSGGCLETDLAEHAREVHANRQPRVVTYDTRADDETAWGLGLGCNGLIDVLLEPLAPVEAGAIGRLIEQGLAAKTPTALATVIMSPGGGEGAPAIGAHALLSGETIETTGYWGDRVALSRANEDVAGALDAGRRGLVREYEGTVVAFEVVVPAVRLVICGAGPDVVPLVRFGAQLGWNLTVVDHRPLVPEHQERFPSASIAECAEARELGKCIALTPMTAVVVMSHHFARDLDYIHALLASEAAYIGVLGPRARTDRMLSDMEATGEAFSESERLFSPIGMDIGGDGPEAIALSIIAEVSSVMARRRGGHLRDRRAPLHA